MKKASLALLMLLGDAFFVSANGSGAFSATAGTSNPLVQFITLIRNVTEQLLPILVTLAVLAFFWFLIKFIWKGSDNPDERQKGVSGMGWAILAIFVMVSIWGIVQFIGSTTGIQQGGTMHGFKRPGAQ